MYLDSKEWLSLGLYPVTFLFLFTVKFTKDFIDSLRRLCAKIHLRIKSQCCSMLIIFRVDFSLIWRLSVLRPASRHLHSVCRVCMPAGTALAQSVVSAVAGKPPMWYPPPSTVWISHSLWARVAGLCTFSIVFVFFILCLNDDLIQNMLNVSVLLLLLLFWWS